MSDIDTIREALDNFHGEPRTDALAALTEVEQRTEKAEKCIEEIRAELAKVAPRSVTFRRIRDALNRYDEAK